jgi:hypothetical protein
MLAVGWCEGCGFEQWSSSPEVWYGRQTSTVGSDVRVRRYLQNMLELSTSHYVAHSAIERTHAHRTPLLHRDPQPQ